MACRAVGWTVSRFVNEAGYAEWVQTFARYFGGDKIAAMRVPKETNSDFCTHADRRLPLRSRAL